MPVPPPSPEAKNFCMMPWVHLHAWPSGETFPCCLADIDSQVGNTRNQSLQEIWNSPKMRELRLNMLADKPSQACQRCYRLESTGMPSLRTQSRRYEEKHWPKVMQTREDGDAGAVNFGYLDIRFSNLCNLKCRTCSPLFSNSWYSDFVDMFGAPPHRQNLKVREDFDSFWRELEPLLETVEDAYFAGGEPLMSDHHHKIIEFWLARGQTNLKLEYITNFTQVSFKGRSIFDVWNEFKDVKVRPSLDGSYRRGEYLRKNMKWDEVIHNRREMIKRCPNVTFEITPTVSAYNVLHIPDFHREWIELGLIKPSAIYLNFLHDPNFMSLQILPEALKDQVREKYSRHMEWLKTFTYVLNEYEPDQQFRAVLDFLDQESHTELIPKWLERTALVDRQRGENVFEIFPELEAMRRSSP